MPADPPTRAGRLDVPGAVLATGGIALLVLAVARAGDTLSYLLPSVVAVVAFALLGGFVLRERSAASPLLNVALLADRGILGANVCLIAIGAFNAGQVLLDALYLQNGRHLSPVLTGLCFLAQAAGALLLTGTASSLVLNLGPRRSLRVAMFLALVSLVGGALAVSAQSLLALLATLFVMGAAVRIGMVAATLAGTHGPVALKSEGTASALLTATRQSGSALGVALVSATLVVAHGNTTQRTEIAMFVAAGFALAGLLATRVLPSGPAHS
jgi:hypothetical protein